ncbi:MAG: hypothetical protein ACRD43_12050 [Pyrinomonadaceae bacterium]
MAILVGIDGTGSAFTPGAGRDAEYDIAFADSFVRRICNAGGPNAKYFRGPVALGGGLVAAINAGYSHIVSKRQTPAGSRESVLLTGYSRGAAGVVSLAKKLKDANIPVRAMLLFDCVDRHLFIDADVIPNNVGYVHHVIRDPASSSRESFGNDGMRYSPPTVYPAAYKFMCTHGGMGGCPWTPGPGQSMSDYINEGGYDGTTTITFTQDAAVSATVWSFCQTFMTTHGFR